MQDSKPTLVGDQQLSELFKFYLHFTKTGQATKLEVLESIQMRCVTLFQFDEEMITISNTNGQLCVSYPPLLILPNRMYKKTKVNIVNQSQPSKAVENSCRNDSQQDNGINNIVTSANSEDDNLSYLSGYDEKDKANDDLVDGKVDGKVDGSDRPSTEQIANKSEDLKPVPTGLPTVEELASASWEKVIMEARFARVRGRFPFPVVFYGDKCICRSATISRGAESMYRNITSKISNLWSKWYYGTQEESSTSFDVSVQRIWDNELLRRSNITHLCDFMVENKRKLYGITLCSSEKASAEGYSNNDVLIQAMPYPGRELFRFNQRPADKKYLFSWEEAGLETSIRLDVEEETLDFDVSDFKAWDLLDLTKNYFKILLQFLTDTSPNKCNGILVHCLSGWDRTPLFVSLIRISLWADGEIHSTLSTDEFLYLTIAYDWLLFCHQIYERLVANEEIMFFCFDFLSSLCDPVYSVHYHQQNHPNAGHKNLDQLYETRRQKLTQLHERFQQYYSSCILQPFEAESGKGKK